MLKIHKNETTNLCESIDHYYNVYKNR